MILVRSMRIKNANVAKNMYSIEIGRLVSFEVRGPWTDIVE